MDKKTLIAAIAGLVIGAVGIYVSLPVDKQDQIAATTTKVASVICSESSDTLRKYFLDMIQKEYPDQKIEDLCGEGK